MTQDADVLSDRELQMRLFYAVVVAGKSAKFADAAVRRFQEIAFTHNRFSLPFEIIRIFARNNVLGHFLRKARVGNYTKIEKFLREIVEKPEINLRKCSAEQLEAVHGIGPKTARFFIMWTRTNERLAALDVHVLRWLGARGHKVPRATPAGANYDRLEKIFIAEADARGLTPRQLDWQIWQAGSGYGGDVQGGPGATQ